MSGWIKLHRKILESDMYQQLNAKQKVVLFTLLLMANHKPKKWEWQGDIYELQPGQMITSLESIRQKCGKDVSIQTVRSALLKLEKWQFLTNKSTKKGRLITIVNWDIYQSKLEEDNKELNRQPTKSQQTTNKQLTTNKNIKNEKNEKNDKEEYIRDTLSNDKVCSTSDVVEPSVDSSRSSSVPFKKIAELWNQKITEHNSILPQLKCIKPNTQRWRSVRARWRDFPNLAEWELVFEKAARSSFLNGNNQRGFVASFDWIVKSANNFLKVLEGNYDDRDTFYGEDNSKPIKWKDLVEFNDANPEAVARNIKGGNMDESTVPPHILAEAKRLLAEEAKNQTTQEDNLPENQQNVQNEIAAQSSDTEQRGTQTETCEVEQHEPIDLLAEVISPFCKDKRRQLEKIYGPYVNQQKRRYVC